jgi:type IV pilus assembly protein PilA
MLNKLRVRAQGESGFTLVELLVVMLILGLLAAIAIPSFFNQRDKAKDADAKAAVRTAQTAMETYATDHDGAYNGPPAPTATALAAIEETLGDVGANLTVTATADDYAVQVDEPDTGNSFRITRDSAGSTTLACGTTVAVTAAFGNTGGEAGCPDDETWG